MVFIRMFFDTQSNQTAAEIVKLLTEKEDEIKQQLKSYINSLKPLSIFLETISDGKPGMSISVHGHLRAYQRFLSTERVAAT
jgi:hypothetical protein